MIKVDESYFSQKQKELKTARFWCAPLPLPFPPMGFTILKEQNLKECFDTDDTSVHFMLS